MNERQTREFNTAPTNFNLSRFGLLHLFYVTAVFAAAIALMGTWGVAWAFSRSCILVSGWTGKKRKTDSLFGKASCRLEHANEISAAALMEGSVYSVGTLEEPSEIRGHFTIALLPTNDFNELAFQGDRIEQVKAEGYILVAINFFLAVLLSFWVGRSPTQK